MKKFSVSSVTDLKHLLYGLRGSPDIRLGELLVSQKIITEPQLQEALEEQASAPTNPLGRLLVEMQFASREQVSVALARRLGIPYVSLEHFTISTAVMSRLPAEIALQYNVLPLCEIDSKLIVAMANPLDDAAATAVRFNTNVSVESVMADRNEIESILHKFYTKLQESEALEDLELASFEQIETVSSVQVAEQEAQRKPIVRLLNSILLQGVVSAASDINIRPEEDRVEVFYRVDGKLQHFRTLNKTILPALVNRIKITGKMNIAERRLPQDGHARMNWYGHSIDLRISVVPTVKGESVVIRILDKNAGMRPLDQLGLQEREHSLLNAMIARPHGLLVVTGPTGSGKSTTLYAILQEVKKRNVHIISVEDPVEYAMEGVEQVQIAAAQGYTFSQALRQFLRHDPDVVMLGEIRDAETARIANNAALTGHLVLSTLHTNDACSTVARLAAMGIEPYLLSSTLMGVLAQRLVRVNCPQCKEKERIDPYVRRGLDLDPDELFFAGQGCEACNGVGYRGRTTVCELLDVTPRVTELIYAGASTQSITAASVGDGMVSLRQYAIALAREGITSIEEVVNLTLDA